MRTTGAAVLCVLCATIGGAQNQNPPRLVKGWAALMQGMTAVEQYIAVEEWSAMHNEESTLSTAVAVLQAETKPASAAAKQELAGTLTAFGRHAGDMHAAADVPDPKRVRLEAQKLVAAYARLRKLYGADVLGPAARLAAVYACPMHRDVTGKRGEACARCAMPLDQPVRIPLMFFGVTPQNTVRAMASTDARLEIGRQAKGLLRLHQISGEPILTTDLRVVHTQRIHLLVADGSLSDYHHLHPQPTAVPGEYAFTFTPARPGPYRAWADLRTTYAGFQEYAVADIPAATRPQALADRRVTVETTVDGLTYALRLEKPTITANEPARMTLRVSDAKGRPFTRLEPLMDAFAHLVAFNEDGKTVLHVHPKAVRPPTAAERGGPELEFQVYATRAGFYRLFSQVQIRGASKFAPFGIVVAPPRQTTTASK